MTEQIVDLMKKASATGKQAKEMIDSAQSTVDTAMATTTQRRAEAAHAVHNATVAHQKTLMAQKHALEAQSNATEFKVVVHSYICLIFSDPEISLTKNTVFWCDQICYRSSQNHCRVKSRGHPVCYEN